MSSLCTFMAFDFLLEWMEEGLLSIIIKSITVHLLFVIVIVGQISDDLTLIKPLQLWHNHCFWMNHIEHKPPWNLRQMCNYASFSKEMQMHIVATNGPSSLLLKTKKQKKSKTFMNVHPLCQNSLDPTHKRGQLSSFSRCLKITEKSHSTLRWFEHCMY